MPTTTTTTRTMLGRLRQPFIQWDSTRPRLSMTVLLKDRDYPWDIIIIFLNGSYRWIISTGIPRTIVGSRD